MTLRQMGQRVLDASPYYPPPNDLPVPSRIVSNMSPIFSLHNLVASSDSGGRASSTWQSVNDPVAFPFVLPRTETVFRLGWMNGSAAGGNADVGIYDSAWARLVSTGSTAAVTNSVPQFADVTDTVLSPGVLYYLAYVRDSVTANQIQRVSPGASAPALGLGGMQSSSTDSIPLPNPLVGMGVVTATFTIIPVCFMAFRDSPL